MSKASIGIDQFTRAVATGLRARSRYVLLPGELIVMVGPDGTPLPRTISDTRKEAIAALGPEIAPSWRRRGYRPVAVRFAAPVAGKAPARSQARRQHTSVKFGRMA